jgi:hypothetical protein
VTTQKLHQEKENRQLKPPTNQEYSCTSPIGVMGRRREGNYTPQKKKNSIEDFVGNEEKGTQFLTPTKQ